ncbi:quinone-dependent dihydroorotate dehydrogenase [Aliidiomarina maris]|uniref:Dihydroorotate dehydrogenase (quinone) n=1 Tax=Aliidiomarina maris TaxID=531312 RepID=A0A327WYW0_9GAMM|nr:quinone-dependent dihydroorotate dehydrogenase [Aliidiomarina maris]RAJ98940.1 dihydroorotate oxidase A [Aliidiomarina maris]RUO25083.1 dihydroorotate dehydrogenase (quinone) [Aliidiomarina maris]
MDWYPWVRRQLFKLDAEASHDWALKWLARIGHSPLRAFLHQSVAAKPVQCMGLEFPNPVGLAAGLDKNATCIDAFAQMGFGFIEVGTVTPKAQPGNPKPRMFRLPEHRAIINRMGFNNDGVDGLVARVKAAKYRGILGINLGKNKDTPETDAVNDYLIGMDKVYEVASYITINISSPNTPGLRNLQHGEHLDALLNALKQRQQELAARYGRYVPIAVKIAPDLSAQEVNDLATAFNRHAIDGVIATNTTLSRDAVNGHACADEAGGLSGAPVAPLSVKTVAALRHVLAPEIPIIGVGGIDNAAQARALVEAGASLVQIYTGFIYQGPKLVREVVDAL